MTGGSAVYGRASVGSLFRAQTDETPDAPFVIFEGSRWTYSEAFRESDRFAQFVRGASDGVGTPRVAAYLTNSARALFAWLGTQLAGGIFIPLNRSQRGHVLNDMVERARPDVLVVEDVVTAVPVLPALRHGVPVVLTSVAEGFGGAPDGGIGDEPHVLSSNVSWFDWSQLPESVGSVGGVVHRRPGDLAGILYTSGTTGRSKAVMMTHAQYCRGGSHVAESLGLTHEDIAHLWVPLFHVAGQVDLAMAHMSVGGAVAIFPTFSRTRFVEQIRESGATVSLLFPALLRGLLDDHGEAGAVVSPLRSVIAAHVPDGLGGPFESVFQARLYDVYGMTEAEPLAAPHWSERTPAGSCGRPNPDFELAIVDADDQVLPSGRHGEIVARPLVPHVLSPGYEHDDAYSLASRRNLWFHTGDLGMIDAEGFVYFKERMGNAIRVKGENVSAWEIEREILRYAAVGECAAIGIPNADGEHDIKLVVTWADEHRADDPLDDVEALHRWCVAELASFMVPRYFEIRSELPYTETAKVKRSELRGIDPMFVWDSRGSTT